MQTSFVSYVDRSRLTVSLLLNHGSFVVLCHNIGVSASVGEIILFSCWLVCCRRCITMDVVNVVKCSISAPFSLLE